MFLSIFIVLIACTGISIQQENVTSNAISTNVFDRIVHRFDLRKLFPDVPDSETFVVALGKPQGNYGRKIKLIHENEKIFLLTSSIYPGRLTFRLNVQSSINPNGELRVAEQVFNIKAHPDKKIYNFELEVRGRLETILQNEKEILDEFKNKLWTNAACPECLTIFEIEPEKDGKFEVTIGSSQPHSDVLRTICKTERIPPQHLLIEGLFVDRTETDCDTEKRPADLSPGEWSAEATISVRTVPK